MSKLKDEGYNGASEAIGTVYYSAPILTATLGMIAYSTAGGRVNGFGILAGGAAADAAGAKAAGAATGNCLYVGGCPDMVAMLISEPAKTSW